MIEESILSMMDIYESNPALFKKLGINEKHVLNTIHNRTSHIRPKNIPVSSKDVLFDCSF